MARWDWSEHTSGLSGLSLLGRAIRDSITVDALEGKDDFVAVALTDLFPLSAEQMMGIDAASTSINSRGNPRYGFHGRALGPQSPVGWLPDPCDPARAGTSAEQKATNWWLIKTHTLFYTTSTDNSFNITRGDKVHVRFDHPGDPPYKYNVKYGKIIGVAAHENPDDQGECASLIDLFGNIARSAVPIGSGAPTGTGPVIPASDRDAAITQFYGVLSNIPTWPSWATAPVGGQRGRTIQEGRAMIYRFADQKKANDSRLNNNGDPNDAAQVERLRKILTARPAATGYGMAIASPESSNHCAGAGCRNQTVIAFDIGANSPIRRQEIGNALRLFFNDDNSITGMKLNLAAGHMFGGFNDGSFVAGLGSGVGRPGQGYYGWREEKNNKAVHIEFKYPGTP